ncbi:MAG: helix-turn-helix domain-containing protein, partial [Gammaproteobacteria bacterium]|nr:helix-turn-helix domain-containing protein [Gammaproteobacteria bacterium]MYF02484.1 helix-turn-helix domain-containing protein [Gammaproteobacteria bacterium]
MAKPYQHLTEGNRIIIEHERGKGTSCKQIAHLLGKHPTTVSREVRRNSLQNGHYDAQVAQGYARECVLNSVYGLDNLIVSTW